MSTQVLSVNLPSSTLYVSGTVNDVPCTWTNTEGNTWETIADRAPSDIYHVALSVIDSAGVTTEMSLTLYLGISNLITDRTPADVERVKRLAAKGYANMTEAERNEWNAGLKGAYNASDLNRVEAAMVYLADRFNALGYSVTPMTPRIWRAEDAPLPEDMAEYLSEVEKLRAVIPVMQTTPDVPPDIEKLTYSEANDIEKILLDINTLLNNMTAAWFYSGDIYSGEV